MLNKTSRSTQKLNKKSAIARQRCKTKTEMCKCRLNLITLFSGIPGLLIFMGPKLQPSYPNG